MIKSPHLFTQQGPAGWRTAAPTAALQRSTATGCCSMRGVTLYSSWKRSTNWWDKMGQDGTRTVQEIMDMYGHQKKSWDIYWRFEPLKPLLRANWAHHHPIGGCPSLSAKLGCNWVNHLFMVDISWYIYGILWSMVFINQLRTSYNWMVPPSQAFTGVVECHSFYRPVE